MNTKAGARHSAADMQHIQSAHDACVKAGAVCGGRTEKAVQIAHDAHPGAMVALMLTSEQQQAIRDAAGMPDAEADHITLAYLAPDASAIEASKNDLLARLTDVANECKPIDGTIGGLARFNASESSDGMDVLVALYDAPGLPALYNEVAECLSCCSIAPASDHGFIPHITLAYVPTDAKAPIVNLPRDPLTIDTLSLVWAGERIDLPLLGMGEESDDDAAEDDDAMAYAPVAEIKAIAPFRLKVRGIVRGGHDLVGDTFTKDTDLGLSRSPIGMPVYYDHAQRGVKSQVGTVVGYEDTGDAIDFDVELDRAKRYAAELMRLGESKALGGSTGAVGHLVIREDGTLKRWIIGELSLTPTPAEPRTRPDLRDTKSAAAPETEPEPARSAGASRKALEVLVTAYTTANIYDIAARLGRAGRTTNHG